MKKCPICQAQYEDTDDFCLEHPEAVLQVVTAKTSAENPSSPKTEQTQKQDYSQKKSPQPEMERHFSEHQDTGNLVKFCSVCQRQYAESFDYCVDHPDVLLERLHHDAGHQSQSQTDNQHTTGTSTSNKQSADNSHQQPQEETTPDSPFAESAQETPTGFGAATTNNTTNNGDQVDDLFAEMNGRSSSDGASQNTASAKSTTDNQTALQLPAQLLADGWALTSEVPLMTAAFSRYQIQRGDEYAYFTLYAVGSLTTADLYTQLVNHTPSWLTPVLYHGTLTSHGQILTYDVTTALDDEFQPLKEWLKTNPSEQRAVSLFVPFNQLITAIIKSHVVPMTLAVEDIFICPRTLQLNIVSHGALKNMVKNQPQNYQNDLSNSPLVAAPFAAPEMLNNSMWAANSVVFSMGQILYQAYFGQPVILQEVLDGNVPFAAIADHKLAKVLMGSLWYSPERWTLETLSQALTRDLKAIQKMAVPNWANRRRDSQAGSGFEFEAVTYHRLEDIILTMMRPDVWDESLASIERLLLWMETSTYASRAAKIRTELTQGMTADVALIRLCKSLHPQSPLTWREFELEDGRIQLTLRSLAHDVINQDEHAKKRIEELFAADLSKIFQK